MDFQVGMAYGLNYLLSIKNREPNIKLTVEPDRFIIDGIFNTIYFERENVLGFSDYGWPWWLFRDGIRMQHDNNNYSPFIVFWAYDISKLKQCLIDSGYDFTQPN